MVNFVFHCRRARTGTDRQLYYVQELAKHDLSLLSAFEHEFTLHDLTTSEPVFNTREPELINTLAMYEDVINSIMAQVAEVGVQVEKCDVEWAPAQFEFTFRPQFGVETADSMFRFRQAVREITRGFGMKPTFMACPYFVKDCYNGFHMNISLWSGGENVLFDGDDLSETGRHFLGGVIAHFDALMCFYSPTINCYRRVKSMAVRGCKDWGWDSRLVSVRVVRGREKGKQD